MAQAGDTGHVMNLGHGIEATTPEPSAALFVDTVHAYKHKGALVQRGPLPLGARSAFTPVVRLC